MPVVPWPMCCGARQLIKKIPSKKVKDWQSDFLDNDDYGFLASNLPSAGLTELVPGFYYFCGEEWDSVYLDSPPTSLNVDFYLKYLHPNVHKLLDNPNFVLISNFTSCISYGKKLGDIVQPTKYNFAILANSQHSFHQKELLDLKFEVVKRFLNPYHDGTKCTLFMRKPTMESALNVS